MTDAPALAIRRLRSDDVETVAGFERGIAVISFPDDPVTDLGFYERRLRAAIDDRKSDPMVAELGGAIAGWVWVAERENFTTRERYGDLRSFYVAEPWRGAGPAFALMRWCVDHARSRGYARLVGRTAAANEAMQAVYELYGFEARHVVYELGLFPSAPPAAGAPVRRARSAGFRKRGSRRA